MTVITEDVVDPRAVMLSGLIVVVLLLCRSTIVPCPTTSPVEDTTVPFTTTPFTVENRSVPMFVLLTVVATTVVIFPVVALVVVALRVGAPTVEVAYMEAGLRSWPFIALWTRANEITTVPTDPARAATIAAMDFRGYGFVSVGI